jgi:predicted RNase H-like HicB family nuclease
MWRSYRVEGEKVSKGSERIKEVSTSWKKAFGEAVQDLFEILAERHAESASRLHELEQEVKHLKQELGQAQKTIVIPITTFAPEPYDLTREVQVLVRSDDDSYVATLVDGNINASGETVPEAVANLKDMMIILFERLGKERGEILGKYPTRQLAVLRELMQRKVRHAAHRQTAR